MLVLRQKIQMIAELILELSEHSQQIGNTIYVVDDIAEQTNNNYKHKTNENKRRNKRFYERINWQR